MCNTSTNASTGIHTNWETYASDTALYLGCTPSTIPGNVLSAALRIAGNITRAWRKQTGTDPESSDEFFGFFTRSVAANLGCFPNRSPLVDEAITDIAYWDCLEVC